MTKRLMLLVLFISLIYIQPNTCTGGLNFRETGKGSRVKYSLVDSFRSEVCQKILKLVSTLLRMERKRKGRRRADLDRLPN